MDNNNKGTTQGYTFIYPWFLSKFLEENKGTTQGNTLIYPWFLSKFLDDNKGTSQGYIPYILGNIIIKRHHLYENMFSYMTFC